jgi:predicted naringenin-chalcone synthase
LDKAEKSLNLAPHQLAASRETLRDFGNMSSATILFVLQRLLQQAGERPQTITAMAFGPGLTIECGLLETVPARTAESARTGSSELADKAVHAPACL